MRITHLSRLATTGIAVMLASLTASVAGAQVTTTSGGITAEDETVERTWFPLFSEMLSTAFENASRRRFPERTTLAASGAKR